MGLEIKRLTNANVYLDGASLLGKVEEFDLPTLKQKMSDHKAMGMIGEVELPSGLQKMEARFKWASFYSDVITKAGNPYKSVSIQVRGSVEQYGAGGKSADIAYKVFMTCSFKELPLGNFKPQDNVEFTSLANVTYIRVEQAGKVLIEVDVLANIYRIDGVDILAEYRANLGL